MDFEIAIIGAGVVGLAIAEQLSRKWKNIIVIEKNEKFGMETSSRSSEVIHAGVYYPQGSLKAKLCIRGNELLYEIAEKNGIPYKRCGKLIVATSNEEIEKLEGIVKNAQSIGARDVRIVDKHEIKVLEPLVFAQKAIFFPFSGIIDSHSLMRFFYVKAKERGVEFLFRNEVVGIEKRGESYELRIKSQDEETKLNVKIVINCAGLNSGKIAQLVGFDIEKLRYRIYYRKGVYFRVTKNLHYMPKMLIYPVPPEEATVGIHTVPELNGGIRLGPYDTWADSIDYSVDENLRDLFYESTKKFLPFLNLEDIQPDMAGFQAKRYGPNEKSMDFLIKEESDNGFPFFINLIGIESPGLTSSPAIGEYVSNIVNQL